MQKALDDNSTIPNWQTFVAQNAAHVDRFHEDTEPIQNNFSLLKPAVTTHDCYSGRTGKKFLSVVLVGF